MLIFVRIVTDTVIFGRFAVMDERMKPRPEGGG
jgi:hypothetical protein